MWWLIFDFLLVLGMVSVGFLGFGGIVLCCDCVGGMVNSVGLLVFYVV